MNRVRYTPAALARLIVQIGALVLVGAAMGIAFAELVLIPVFAGGGHG